MSRLSMLIHDSLTALANPLCSVPPVSSLPCDLVVGGWWWGIAILKLLSRPCDFSKTVLKWPSVSWVSNCDPHDVTQCTREGYLQVGKTCWEKDFASDFIQGASLIFKHRSAKMQLLPTTKNRKRKENWHPLWHLMNFTVLDGLPVPTWLSKQLSITGWNYIFQMYKKKDKDKTEMSCLSFAMACFEGMFLSWEAACRMKMQWFEAICIILSAQPGR